MAASSQPLAVEAAIHVLRAGGNAVDAAVTATAVLGVTEPMSTGFGGDGFALVYSAKEQRLMGLNASGRAPRAASADALLARGERAIPTDGPLSVTVPGALDGLALCLAKFGTRSLGEALEPAIYYAQEGFPIAEITAQWWARHTAKLARHPESARVYLPNGRAPLPGEVFKNPDLARTLRAIADSGTEALYRGEISISIAKALRDLGGLLSPEDLAAHSSDWVQPITSSYRGYDVFEMPPNNQGLTALLALNIAEGFNLAQMGHGSAEHLHTLIETTKLALADARAHIADPHETIPLEELLSKRYAQERRALIDPGRTGRPVSGILPGDTVYIAVVDEERNVVSMITSLFNAFGSGITAPGTGLLLQNRGACFTLEPGHPNRLGPNKRPYHTIMPAMILRGGRPWACFGVVGGMMQAQGHLQVICNLIDFEMNPQEALDAPRFRVIPDVGVALEEGISDSARAKLAEKGHNLNPDTTEEGFGGGQVILISDDALLAGSDPRKDGCAMGY